MQKIISLAVVFACLFLQVANVQAQAPEITFDELTVQIWPEYDKPQALVFYDFSVAAAVLPVTVQIRIPAGSELFAVAQNTEQGLMNFTYDSLVTEGDYTILTLTLTDPSIYRVEYYAPLARMGNLRQYEFTWPGDYAVKSLLIFVQKPIGAQKLSTQPVLEELPGQDGFVYAQGQFDNLPAGEPFLLNVTYEKSDDTLSAASQPASLAGGLDTAQGRAFSLTNSLPWLLGGLGVVLIVGGVFWFWQSGQSRQTRQPARRKRHAAREDEENDQRVYCSQCGKRAEAADRFCRACGARLRRDE